MLDLPKHPVAKGHPVHAMLSDLPIGLLPAALTAAVAARGSRRRSGIARLSDGLTALTFGTALSAGAFGIWDWLTIPRSHSAWWPATIHGSINLSGAGMLGAALALPHRRLQLLASVGAATLVGAWLGGELVFAHGWRVKPAEEFEIVAEHVRSDGDGTLIREAQQQVADFERQKTFFG
jgi:uncharacterized membrane protein